MGLVTPKINAPEKLPRAPADAREREKRLKCSPASAACSDIYATGTINVMRINLLRWKYIMKCVNEGREKVEKIKRET